MMLDMMLSEPLPAITFSILVSNFSREHAAQIQAAVGIEVEAAHASAPWLRCASGEGPRGFSLEASLLTRLKP